MKKIVIAILVMGLLVTGLWWTIRRKPGTVPPLDENSAAFHVTPAANGILIHYEDPQTPLRALRWLPPLPDGQMIVQVVTQSDRQQISLFKNGVYQDSYLVPKPVGVRDGFFRLAELRDALIVDGEVAVLLYAMPDAGEEPPLVVAYDLKTKDIRWIHRAKGEHLVLAPAKDVVVYLYGSRTPPVRLPLALASGEQTSATGARAAAKTIELPPEIQDISDLQPTGAWTFLVAHKGGLSAYLGSKGWQHHPMPEGNPGFFRDIQGVLAESGKKYWWQPYPGKMLQVLPDGTPRQVWSPDELTTAGPFEKDASLLHLVGADADGRLWFDLATPTEPPPAESPAASAPPADAQWKPETPAAPSPESAPSVRLEDWPTYVNQGLDRVYCWDIQKKSLQRFKWASLAVPQGFQKPASGLRLYPLAGSILLENGASSWLTPLSSLSLGEPSTTGKPNQVK